MAHTSSFLLPDKFTKHELNLGSSCVVISLCNCGLSIVFSNSSDKVEITVSKVVVDSGRYFISDQIVLSAIEIGLDQKSSP
jgi:hypothetical protein